MSQSNCNGKPLVLVTLIGGGYHREMYRILSRFPPDEFDFAYVYGHHSGVHGSAALPMPHPGPVYPIHDLGPTRKRPLRFFSNNARLMLGIVEAFRLIRRLRPHAIVAVGTATAVPLFLAGKFYGSRCVFIECLTRVQQLSLTGRILYHLRLADRLYVQWALLQRKFGRTTYAGAVI
ncbi:MAG: hypothetical protein JXQ75_10765 [Phycisphaerae bacterium]|nr:hypothetical protein [Phycisphaerae bacterium]